VISSTVLVVAEPLDDMSVERVAGALASGLRGGDRGLQVDVALEELPSAGRLRSARAVIVATARLDERTLAGSLAFETATSARQAGVPAYAVTANNALDLFDTRMLDLQVVLQAQDTRGLKAAGRRLAEIV
jgi:glycerate 2-kinase